MDLLSVPEAARELSLDQSRVRALLSSGQIHGVKLGGRWAVDRTEVARRRRDPQPAGRPLEVHNAWGLLFIASDLEAPWLDPSVRWRLRQSLAFRGLASLRPRLSRRAEIHHFHAHPGELRRLCDRPDLVKSGISAAGAYGLGLVAGEEADGYVRARVFKRIQRDHALEPAPPTVGNVILRVVPDQAWQFESGREAAPLAAVAIDLAEDADSRSSRIGMNIIERLDRDLRKP